MAIICRLGEKPIKIWNFWEKFEIYIQRSQWKIDFFTHFLCDLPGSVSFYTILEKGTIFYHIYGFGGGGFPPIPQCGSTCFCLIHWNDLKCWTPLPSRMLPPPGPLAEWAALCGLGVRTRKYPGQASENGWAVATRPPLSIESMLWKEHWL